MFDNINFKILQAFKHQTHKRDKHTQKVCLQQPKNCLSVFDHFVGLTLKGLRDFLCVGLSKKVGFASDLLHEAFF